MNSLLFVLTLTFTLPATAAPTDLYGLCLGLKSGDPLLPQAKKLLGTPSFDAELKQALQDPDRLRDAACVISETGKKSHLEALLAIPSERLVPEVFSAISRLKDDKNQEPIRKAMLTWIADPDREDRILRTIGALQLLESTDWSPGVKELRNLLDSKIPEVRARSHELLFRRFSKLTLADRTLLMAESLKKDPLQVRVVALRTYKSLSEPEKKALKVSVADCKKDPEPEVREECP